MPENVLVPCSDQQRNLPIKDFFSTLRPTIVRLTSRTTRIYFAAFKIDNKV